MNQEKIGKFIAKSRKEKNMTQSELAEKLGVSDRTIGNWENGRNMPDLSLFKPLCNVLDISINSLLSGETIENENDKKCEENIFNAIEYTKEILNGKDNLIGLIFIFFGLLITISAMTIFPSESSWGSIYSIIGIVFSLIGIARFTKKLKPLKRYSINVGYFILTISLLILIDYIGVVNIKQAPRFSLLKESTDNMIIYKAPFYNVYRINFDTKNEYYIIDTNKKFNKNTVPNVPFNRSKSGIENIIKYKNKYIGNNSNTGSLINSLPLSEYGYTFEIDSNNLKLTINYHMTDWYIAESGYLNKSLLYDTVSLFALIENLNYVEYNFSGKSYEVSREKLEKFYPHYEDIVKDGINKSNFNVYLESKLADDDFIDEVYKDIFN